jgi:hypothetical protein
MKLISKNKNVSYICLIDKQLIYRKEQFLISLFPLETNLYIKDGFRINEKYIGVISNNSIEIYNNRFEKISSFTKTFIKNHSGFEILNSESIIIYGPVNNMLSRSLIIDYKFKEMFLVSDFQGRIVSKKYLQHKLDSDNYITHFKFTDLYNTKTYFTYQCSPEYGCDLYFYCTWQDYFIFIVTKRVNNEFYHKLIKIHIETGNVDWEQDVDGQGFNFDESTGRLMSMYNKDSLLCYHVADLATNTYTFNKVAGDISVGGVATHYKLQTVANNKIYFTESVRSYVGQKNCPKVGCFNLETLELEFLKEEKSERGGGFAQIIFNEGMLYLVGTKEIMYEYEV